MPITKNTLAALVLAAVLSGCSGAPPAASSAAGLNVLVFSKTSWYRHPEVPNVNGWLAALGAREGFTVHVTETGADFSEKRLEHYQVVVLNNTTDIGKSLDEKQKAAFRKWFQGGGGIVGLHAAAVHHNTWEWYTGVLGCDFDSDSNFVKARLVVDPAAKNHPSVAGRPASFWYTADWQSHDRAVTGLPGVKVLLRADESTFEVVRPYFKERGKKPMGDDHPVSWIREAEGGRIFYTALGHDVRSLDTDFGRQHVLGGVVWAAGAGPGNR